MTTLEYVWDDGTHTTFSNYTIDKSSVVRNAIGNVMTQKRHGSPWHHTLMICWKRNTFPSGMPLNIYERMVTLMRLHLASDLVSKVMSFVMIAHGNLCSYKTINLEE